MKQARPLIEDMVKYAETAIRHGRGYDAVELAADEMRYLAVQRALEIFGEAAANIRDEARRALEDVPFRQAIAMRNRIIHGYGRVDPAVVADTVKQSLPDLIVVLQEALAKPLPDEQ